MNAAAAALTALLFGLAGWTGVILAHTLCAGRAPRADGPAPVAFAAWPFAVAGACAGLAVAMHAPSLTQLAVLTVAVLALAGCAAADLTCGMLPDVLTLGPLAAVLAVAGAAHDWSPAISAAVVVGPFAIAALLSRGYGMGWGDVKLAALGGALLGVRDATLAFALAAAAAYLISRRSGAAGRPIAFGPYLAASIVVAFAAGGIH